ncbi:phage major capsid protein [Flavobacterium algicola]|uniref:phage major capsid protein n=1 Tax=Flavobacterium algicola TaxID=556529 RepID=UPI001EFE3138|nr:phage major capsid protein [Flavobacterium algicola]MCG9792489.1 phage major capsid protein [Flavobacterium algicola]
MKKSAELKQERAQKIAAQQEVTTLATTEKRSLNAEETTSFRSLQTEIEGLTAEIGIAETLEENQRSLGGSEPTSFKPEGEQRNADPKKPVFSLHRAIRSQMINGGVNLEGAELEMHQRASGVAAVMGIGVSGFALETRAAQTVTENGGVNGGALVATDLKAPIDFLRPEPLMKKLGAVYQSGLTGNLRYPKNQGGIVATWEGEIDEVDETVNVYGFVDSIPKRLAVTVPISLQNLMQSSIDLEAYTAKEINAAIENAIDAAAINGSGVGQPMGVLNVSGTNTVATDANGSAATWSMMVDLETAIFVNNASAAKMAYVMNPKTRGKLKKTKHEAGDLGYIMDSRTGEVNGWPSVTSNHIPSNLVKGTGTGLSAAVFGDWTQLLINQWGYMDFSVDEFSRKKEGLIEITVNVFLDVLVKQPQSFSVVKGLITV